jgi:hypothetical protein
VKIFEAKSIAFVTFINAVDAAAFMAKSEHVDILIRGKKVKIGYGKASSCSKAIRDFVDQGGSRNIYLGHLHTEIHTTDKLVCDLSLFGEVEHVTYVDGRRYAFVEFADISSAIKAKEMLESWPEYQSVKVGFGRDRCAKVERPEV